MIKLNINKLFNSAKINQIKVNLNDTLYKINNAINWVNNDILQNTFIQINNLLITLFILNNESIIPILPDLKSEPTKEYNKIFNKIQQINMHISKTELSEEEKDEQTHFEIIKYIYYYLPIEEQQILMFSYNITKYQKQILYYSELLQQKYMNNLYIAELKQFQYKINYILNMLVTKENQTTMQSIDIINNIIIILDNLYARRS